MELYLTVPAAYAGYSLRSCLRAMGVSETAIRSIKYCPPGFLLDGRPVHTDVRVQAGQQLSFALPPEQETTVQPQPIPVRIIYQDDFAAVLDKPAGLAVHPTLNDPDGTLANGYCYSMLRQGRPAVFRPVNRIDKNTSGLVLCAQNAFSAPFLARSAHKTYYAVVEGALPLGDGVIDAPVGRREGSIIGRCVTDSGKPSRTGYTVLAAGNGLSFVKCIPFTGRTHQIRVHFSSLGMPLAGDDLYGGHRDRIARHALHCGRMEFRLPFAQETTVVQSPLPADMEALLAHIQ